jgi:hypothetical protein
VKIGVAIDAYKLDVFKKHLKDWNYKVSPGVIASCLWIEVITEDKEGLLEVIKAANIEAKL